MLDSGTANRPKVFGIGFHKTGTTSLGLALERMGYAVCHGAAPVRAATGHRRMIELLRNNELERIMSVAQNYNAFEDNPWFILYEELDRAFPGSQFILTIREEADWLKSATAYYGNGRSDLREWIYGVGSIVGKETLYLDRYRRHNREVISYFASRPNDLLVVDWSKGDGWSDLASFLDLPQPGGPFPHESGPARNP